MFTPKTQRIKDVAKDKQEVIKRLESIFDANTRVYIDYANVRPWSEKLGWHINLKRLKQFLDSFTTIEAINFYNRPNFPVACYGAGVRPQYDG